MSKRSYFVVAIISLLAVGSVFRLEPIAQDPAYHLFADERDMVFVPNSLNVISNIPFLAAGLFGLWGILISKRISVDKDLLPGFIIFFLGVSLVSLGSGYYHLKPSNQTLVWDRLPMTVAFMALFAVTVGEFVSKRYFKGILVACLFFGVFSIAYWDITEGRGAGDLRPYVVVQFLPMILIPVFLIIGRKNSGSVAGYWWLIAFYALSKVVEQYDQQIFGALSIVSGHSLKHVFAATGVLVFALWYRKKQSM